MLGPDLGLDMALSDGPRGGGGVVVVVVGVGAGWEPPGADVLLQQGVFLDPPLAQPEVERLGAVEWDVGDREPAPVEVYGLWGSALEERAREAEVLLSVVATAISLVGLAVWADVGGKKKKSEQRVGMETYGTPSYATVQSYT